MPQRYVTPTMRVGDEVCVFVYLDQEERPVATTERPLATVGQFAFLEVAWVNKYGAFLKWGLMKDLFCPFREQKQRMEQGRSYVVYVKVDDDSYRLMATAKVEKYLSSASLSAAVGGADAGGAEAGGQGRGEVLIHGAEVDCLVWQKTPLGFKCIVDNRYQGQVYDNQLFRPLRTGDRLTAYVDHVRQDGKIDLTLQPTGQRHALELAEVVLRYLYENDGHCDLADSSPAELIYDRFKVSKKAYKRAIGDLYRRRLITIGDDGIRLV